MPLEVLPDRFGKAKHEELDKAVNAAFGAFSAQQILCLQHLLLSYIVATSNDELDPKLSSPTATETLINTHHEDLRDMLSLAWERKSYSDI